MSLLGKDDFFLHQKQGHIYFSVAAAALKYLIPHSVIQSVQGIFFLMTIINFWSSSDNILHYIIIYTRRRGIIKKFLWHFKNSDYENLELAF